MPDRIRVSALILRGESVALVVFHTADLGEHFDLPGGGLEAGESLVDGVRRECYEEIGCTVRVGRLLGVAEHLPEPSPHDHYEGQHVLDFIFECVIEAGQKINLPTVHDEDQIGVAWRPIADLHRAALKPAAAQWLISRARDKQDDLYQQNIWGRV